jgi:hypothetical protein
MPGMNPRLGRSESRRAMSRGHSLAATPFGESPREMSPSQYSMDGESQFTGNPYGGKVLRIKRMVSFAISSRASADMAGEREGTIRDCTRPSSHPELPQASRRTKDSRLHAEPRNAQAKWQCRRRRAEAYRVSRAIFSAISAV